jgi:GntR family transcriptional regulator, transcriptional repressor for pyruvate dehydrogenase complex
MCLPTQPERLYEQIVSQIKQRILAGELKASDKLPSEHELAKQFAVRWTVIREATKALREKRLMEIWPGRGSFVINRMPDAMRHSLRHLMGWWS